jgi:PleD family two-component response regulator
MVLVAVDDLLFSSKIRATAKQVAVDITFARTPDQILSQARALKPSLIVFDVNSQKSDPINTVAALKADEELRTIPTTGFVSHVNTELILAARKAGMDEVMARSAFAANLPQILTEREPRP